MAEEVVGWVEMGLVLVVGNEAVLERGVAGKRGGGQAAVLERGVAGKRGGGQAAVVGRG